MSNNKDTLNSSIITNAADFTDIKENLKKWMKENSNITDVDFEGSVATTFLDMLTYNTYMNLVYLEAAENETSITTARHRGPIVQHASMLGYMPSSYTASRVLGKIVVTPRDSDDTSEDILIVPKYYAFDARIDNRTYHFRPLESLDLQWDGSKYVSEEVVLYEGDLIHNKQLVSGSTRGQYFEIPNDRVDLDTLRVFVERKGKMLRFHRKVGIDNVKPTDRFFWLKENDYGLYEMDFGDGVFGEGLQENDVVHIEYLNCHGPVTNGYVTLTAKNAVEGFNLVSFVMSEPQAYGGALRESTESVRKLAKGSFQAQDRTVTTTDFEYIIHDRFSYLKSISTWGGEDNLPPRFGRVMISAKPFYGEYLTQSEIKELLDYLKDRRVTAIPHEYVDPSYTYIKIHTNVKYNYTQNSLSNKELREIVQQRILDYVKDRLEKFNVPFKYSHLDAFIDKIAKGIVSNELRVSLYKKITNKELRIGKAKDLSFNTKLKRMSISSTKFVSSLATGYVTLTSDITNPDSRNYYKIRFVDADGNISPNSIGKINYESGHITLEEFDVFRTDQPDLSINILSVGERLDYHPTQNVLVATRPEDITVVVENEL